MKKLRILLLILMSYATYTMEAPLRGKRPAQQPGETLQGEPKTRRGEVEPIQELKLTYPRASLMGIPSDIQKIIFGYLETAAGATTQLRLMNAAQNIRNFLMSSKRFLPWLNDEKLAGTIITELAKRYANNNIVVAAQAYATNAANKWLSDELYKKLTPIASESEQLAQVSKLYDYYTSALSNAINLGDVGSMRFLLQNQKTNPINNIRFFTDGKPESLLLAAVKTGKKDMVSLLLKFGANPNYNYLIEKGDKEYEDSVMLAAVKTDLEMLKALVAAGGNLNWLNRYEASLLGFAKNAAIASYLIEQGLDVNQADEDGETPLHLATQKNRVDVVKALLNAGAKPDAIDNHNRLAPLHYAVDADNPEIITELLDGGANILIEDKHGNTPLQRAIKDKKLKAAKILQEREAQFHKS